MLLALAQENPSNNILVNEQVAAKKKDPVVNNNNQKIPENSHKNGSTNQTITVIIGATMGTFSIDELSQLSYFQARFSSRWSNNTSNNSNKEIRIFSSGNSNINSNTNDDTLIFKFDCNDLKLLLTCFKQGKIPNDICLTLKQLESLLYCHDYFNPQSAHVQIGDSKAAISISDDDHDDDDETLFCIDKTVLLSYFRNHVPAFDNQARNEFLSNCKHPLMRSVLTTLNNNYENIMKKCRQNIFCHVNQNVLSLENLAITTHNSADFIVSLIKTIELDPIAATSLFESKFQIKISCSRTKAVNDFENIDITHDDNFVSNLSRDCSLKIQIIDFENTYPKVSLNRDNKENSKNKENKENKENEDSQNSESNKLDDEKAKSVLWDLWKLCDYGRYLNASTFEQIDRMIHVVLDPATMVSKIIPEDATGGKQMFLILRVLKKILYYLLSKQLMIDDKRLRNTKNISIKGCIKTIVLITARSHPTIFLLATVICQMSGQICKEMNENENEELAECMIKTTNEYFRACNVGSKTVDDLKYMKKCVNRWIYLFKNVLLNCSTMFITKNIEKWFVILHKKPRTCFLKAKDHIKMLVIDSNNNGNNNNNNNNNEVVTDEKIDEELELTNDMECEMGQWIIDNLIETTNQCFEFGIYLSKFIVFEKKQEKEENYALPFPQVYIDFMKKHCGITWKLL